MASILRRGTLTAAAILLLVAAATVLVETDIAIGRSSVPTTTSAAFAADVDAALAADTAPTTTTTGPTAATDARLDRAALGLRRLALARRLVHGTVVVDLPNRGGLTTVQIDHGTIAQVGATSMTISEAGGTSVTVSLGEVTHVRKDAARAEIADLASGDEVFVMSKVEGGTAESYLVVVPAV